MKSMLSGAFAVLALASALTACAPSAPSDSKKSADSAGGLSAVHSYIDTSKSLPGPATQQVTQTDGSTWNFTSHGVTLLYFGYTSCPDVCPTTMADLATALRALPSDLTDDVTVRFVSTDPHRDTFGQLRSWLGGFDPDFIGARAPIESVIKAAATYSIGIDPPKVTKHDYEVTHGAQVLVLRPDGRSVGYFRAGTTPAAYEKALPEVLKEAA